MGSATDHWTDGYSVSELDAAQNRFGLIFPPDLKSLLIDRRPVRGYDWRTDDGAIRKALAWPLEGLLFDVEENGLWWPEWNERPQEAEGRASVLQSILSDAPALIPILSHRYIPSEPCEAGNPVFSVYQSDIVHYRANLTDDFDREFGDPGQPLGHEPKRVRFWSDMVDRAYKEPYYPNALEE